MFPRIMGDDVAYKVLAESKSLSASEALECRLVQYIYSPQDVQNEAEKYALVLASHPSGAEELTRRIEKDNLVEILKKVNEKECIECEKKWVCKKSFSAIASYLESRNMNASALVLRYFSIAKIGKFLSV